MPSRPRRYPRFSTIKRPSSTSIGSTSSIRTSSNDSSNRCQCALIASCPRKTPASKPRERGPIHHGVGCPVLQRFRRGHRGCTRRYLAARTPRSPATSPDQYLAPWRGELPTEPFQSRRRRRTAPSETWWLSARTASEYQLELMRRHTRAAIAKPTATATRNFIARGSGLGDKRRLQRRGAGGRPVADPTPGGLATEFCFRVKAEVRLGAGLVQQSVRRSERRDRGPRSLAKPPIRRGGFCRFQGEELPDLRADSNRAVPNWGG